MTWKAERVTRNTVKIKVDMKKRKDWQQWCLLRSDAHHDNPRCDQAMEKRHLEQAVERDAMIIDNGDLFCAMQGKWDKRSDKNAIRPEHQGGNYLDLLVDTTREFYRPYGKQFAVLGRGNHETAIRKCHETDLIDRLEVGMRQDGSPVLASGYGGWVKFSFMLGKCHVDSVILYHYHGSGGGGPVTKGTIQTNRITAYTPDAQVVLTGHTHDDWIFPLTRQRLSDHLRVYRDEQLHIRAPGYKDAWDDGAAGFEVERMHGPKPTGAVWLQFAWNSRTNRIQVEAVRAK